MVYESYSTEDTMMIARDLAARADTGGVYALTGELGAGKTVFVKGFACGMGIKKIITSPTFTIINEYHEGRLPLYHFDVYRITAASEMDDTGCEDYFYGDGVCLVEWAETIAELMPGNAVWITIEKDMAKSDNYRKITVKERLHVDFGN